MTEADLELDGAALGAARIAAVLVHGRDQDASYMRERLVVPLGRDDVAYVLPQAAGRSWYGGRFSAPVEDLEPSLSAALGSLARAVAIAGAAGAAVALVGFSQGGCLVAELLAREGRLGLAGAAVLTGALIGKRSAPGESRRLSVSFDGLPVEMVSSELDELVGPDYVRAAARSLTQAGAAVHLEITAEPEHRIDAAGVAAVARLLYGAAGTTVS